MGPVRPARCCLLLAVLALAPSARAEDGRQALRDVAQHKVKAGESLFAMKRHDDAALQGTSALGLGVAAAALLGAAAAVALAAGAEEEGGSAPAASVSPVGAGLGIVLRGEL